MPTNFITLSRSALYDLVWTKPVTELAKEFGISDVALAKRCRAINIPLPPRGYWARVAAGQTPKRPPLPPFRDSRNNSRLAKRLRGAPSAREPRSAASTSSDRVPSYVSTSDKHGPLAEPTVTFEPRPDPTDAEPSNPISPAEAALRARIDALDITPLDKLTSAHPAVLRTAQLLKRPWRKDITFPRGTRRGPVLSVADVSEAQQDRALTVLDAVLRAAARLGWLFEAPPDTRPRQRSHEAWQRRPPEPPRFGHFIVDGEPLTLRIDERRRQSDHVMTEQEQADKKAGRYVWMPRFDYAPSGELRLHLSEPDHNWTHKTWKDTKTHPLETQLRKILHGLLSIALERQRRREAQRLSLSEIAERERARQQAILRERRTANDKLVHTLEAQAGAWHRARYLRAYLRAARRALDSRTLTVDLLGTPTDFLSWAERYVNQLDPLQPEARDPVFAHERSFQYGADDKRMQDELQRLLGHTWEHASKLVAEQPNQPPPASPRGPRCPPRPIVVK